MDEDDLSCAWEEDGDAVVEELGKLVVARGSWPVVLFRYRERDGRDGPWSAPRYALHRYRKVHGALRPQGKVTLGDAARVATLVDTLAAWIAEDADEA